MSQDVQMAWRDASCYERPNVRSLKMAHVVADDGATAACDPRVLLVTEYGTNSVEAVHVAQRCRRRACFNRWAGAGSPSGETQ